jgi:hypothetical protein
MITGGAQAQQVPLPKTAAEIPGPAPGTAMTKAYVESVGRIAYVWGWPMVNSFNRRTIFSKAPEPGLNGGVLPVAPVGHVAMLSDYIKPDQNFVTCTNQDVVYGAGFLALDKDPVVFQVPDFGDRFWVYGLYDARTDEFAEIGKHTAPSPAFISSWVRVGTVSRLPGSPQWCALRRSLRSQHLGCSGMTRPKT